VQTDAKDPTSTQTTIEDIDYQDAARAIELAIGNATYAGKKRVSFEPELFRSETSEPNYGGTPVAPEF
jgi:hypothetical protein